MHLHGRFFCLRLGREEEVVLARKLAAIAMAMPFAETSSWAGLCINGMPASIQEDDRFWATITMFGSNRKRPDESWDEQGTLEFTMHLPLKWRRFRAAVRLQAAIRGLLARKRLARA